MLKHVGNFPKDWDHVLYNLYIPQNLTMEEAWNSHLEFRKGKIVGRPMANDRYTVEQLEEQGLIGLYVEE